MAKKFFYVCAGLFLLAGAYALGARNAGAQAGTSLTAMAIDGSSYMYVMTPNGDVYSRPVNGHMFDPQPPRLVGNYWQATVPVEVSKFDLGKNEKR